MYQVTKNVLKIRNKIGYFDITRRIHNISLSL